MAGANPFALLESDDAGDTRLADLDSKNQPQQPAATLAAELFGKAYPSSPWIIRSRERQQNAVARTKNAQQQQQQQQQGGARKKQGGPRANGAAEKDDKEPAPRLNDLRQFPSLK